MRELISTHCHPSVLSGRICEWPDSYDWNSWLAWRNEYGLPHLVPQTLVWGAWEEWLSTEDWEPWQDWPGWAGWNAWLAQVKAKIEGFDSSGGSRPMGLVLDCDYHDHETQNYPQFQLFFEGAVEPEKVLAEIADTCGEMNRIEFHSGTVQPLSLTIGFGDRTDEQRVTIEFCACDLNCDGGRFANG